MTAPPTNSTLITDHYAIDFIININTPKVIRKITSFRKLKTINFTHFSVDINDSPYSTLTSISPFHNVLTLLLNKHAPLTNKLIPTHTTIPWFSIELGTQKRLVRKKNRIYNKSPTEYNHSHLSLNRNIKLLKNSKSNYYNDKFNCYKHDCKQLYKLTNKLLGRTKKIILPDLPDIQLCSTFSDYFSDKIKLIYDNLNTLNKQLPDIQLYYDCAILTPTFTVFSLPTTTEIYNLIITSKCYSPSEPLPLLTLKKLASTIVPIHKHCIDESLITGTIPSDLKHSIISPLLKKTQTRLQYTL